MFKTVKQAIFSSGLQSPKCTSVVNEASEYETRVYEPAKWVSTGIGTLKDWDSATGSGFMRLFSYIQGNNENKEKIDMTVPVTTFIQPGEGPACESNLTISFFVPFEHQDNPPKPTDESVFIEERPQMTAYVRTFSGFTNASKNKEQLLQLSESLKKDGKPFDENTYYSAGYDSPFKLLNRRNEVWFLAKS
ncbi:heme-binding protein 2 [Pelobates fuscus]|uniref:heme-binding protein 2 n=1 Tax=Pelobates fuscus TaxID=191477 RepID=UPI002FE4C615